jgi:hypothetical protein
MLGRCEGDDCGLDGCLGILTILPPIFGFGYESCTCFMGHPPCAWCESHELRCDVCSRLPEDGEDAVDTLVSLDIQPESCEPENLLRISPELHFPLNEVFEVPDEFNGHQRGTFYYRNARGTLRGPFMNTEEAGFDLCRHQYSKGIPCS